MTRTAAARALEAYRDTHGGLEPTESVRATVRTPERLTGLGELLAVEYGTDKGDGATRYRHEFQGNTRPVLTFDERGKLHVVRQRDVFITSHGIEDEAPMAKAMTVPNGKGKASRRRYGRRTRRNAGAREYLMNAAKALGAGVIGGGLAELTNYVQEQGTMSVGQRAAVHGGLAAAGAAVGAFSPLLGAGIVGGQAAAGIRAGRAWYATRPTTTPPPGQTTTPPGQTTTPPGATTPPPPPSPPGRAGLDDGRNDPGYIQAMSEYYSRWYPDYYRDSWAPYARSVARELANA